MKSKAGKTTFIALGAFLVAAGLCLVKAGGEPQGAIRALPYVCIAVGCSLFGLGMGSALSERAVGGNAEVKRQLEIERNDERNVAIANRAKAKAFDMMGFVFGALIAALALMGADMAEVVLLIVASLLVQGIALYYRFKFDREM